MLKGLFKDSVIYGIANGVQKLVPFFIIPIITQLLGKEVLKNYDISFTYVYLVLALVVLGQDVAASILFFDEKNDTSGKCQITTYAFLLQILFLGLFFSLLYFFSFDAPFFFKNDKELASVWKTALFILPGHVLLNFSLNILLWQKRKLAYLFLCSLQTFLTLLLIQITVVYLKGESYYLFYSIIASTSLTGLTGIFLIRKNLTGTVLPLNTGLVKKLLLLGLPFALTSFFQQALPSIDRFFLLFYDYGSSMAPYILAIKLGSLFGFGINAFALAFTPYSLAKLNSKNSENEISRLFQIIYITAFTILPLLLIFRNQAISFFADNSYGIAGDLMPFFFYGWAFDLFCYFTMLGIFRSQKTFFILWLYIFGLIVISILNIIIIPWIGLYGAAISFCAAKASLFLASLITLKKYYKININSIYFLTSFLLSVCACILIYKLPTATSIIFFLIILAAVIILLRKGIYAVYKQIARV